MSKAELKLDWCDYKAAKYAVEHWHYSKSLPTPPYNFVGVWEDEKFIGTVIFSRGASDSLGKPYGLTSSEVCELTRVALNSHKTEVTRIISIAFKFLLKQNPLLKLIVSYADPNNGHHGGIYQGGNWLYCGKTSKDYKYIDRTGRVWHSRQVSQSGQKKQYGQYRAAPKISECQKVELLGKHRYLYPLTQEMRDKIEPLRKPYPKPAL
jgi:hypothetical protein